MEFGEKLQQLRKSRNLTQEELAQALYVSRTAVSKWESGRGYPSIDSLKELSAFFSVSIDELLSGEKLISLAEKENASNIRNLCQMLFGMADLFSLLLILLPLYPKTVEGYVYCVNLLRYQDVSARNRLVYWAVYLLLSGLGALKLLLTWRKMTRYQENLTAVSLALGVAAVLFLALAREAYAVTVVFLLLVVKAALYFRQVKVGR